MARLNWKHCTEYCRLVLILNFTFDGIPEACFVHIRMSVSCRSTQYTVCFAETCFPPELQAFARVFTATPDQLKHWVRLAPVELRDKLFSLKWTSEDTQALQFLRTRY